jgi:hypothetical protein
VPKFLIKGSVGPNPTRSPTGKEFILIFPASFYNRKFFPDVRGESDTAILFPNEPPGYHRRGKGNIIRPKDGRFKFNQISEDIYDLTPMIYDIEVESHGPSGLLVVDFSKFNKVEVV